MKSTAHIVPHEKKIEVAKYTPPTSLESWGLSLDKSNSNSELHKFVTEVEVAGRPSNYIYRGTNNSPWWSFYSLMDMYRSEVSIMDTIIMRSVTEIFRYGIDFEPAFAKKCMNCGEEFQQDVKVCPYCNSTNLRRPDSRQKDYFVRPNGTSFLDEANDNGQSLKDVCRSYAEKEYEDNQAYLLCCTGDVIDAETKHLEKSYPLEFLSIDPRFVRNPYDESGKEGQLYGFTMDDRNSFFALDENSLNDKTRDGRTIYPVHWIIGDQLGGTGQTWVYTKDEVYQDHWFRQSLTYGIPHWLSIEDDLLTYHYIEKHNLKKYKFGYVRKIVVLPGFEQDIARQVATGVQDVLSKNDNSIPIVALPPQPPGTPEQKAHTLELGADSASELVQVKNEIRDRMCAHIGVPNLFAGDVVGSGGLNNESQQITTFDRYIADKLDYTDNMLAWIKSWFPKITDWNLCVIRPSKSDQENKKLLESIQVATGMKNLGFQITYTNGEFTYSEKPVDNPMAGPKVNTQVSQNPFTAQDSEAQGTADEVQSVMDEADDQYVASLSARIRKQRTESDSPFSYLKGMSETQYDKYLAKDIYGYLRDNADDIANVLTVGYDVAEHFKTCTMEQAKEIYIKIIETLQKPSWSTKDIENAVRSCNPDFADRSDDNANIAVERIARTELNRILMYAREQDAAKDGESDQLYGWRGPLDKRTTPMCRFLQTGELVGTDSSGKSYDYEYLRASLPEWKKEGWLLPELKQVCRDTHEVFYNAGLVSTEMVGDWSMHINCRHSFHPLSRIPRDEAWQIPPEVEGYIQDSPSRELRAEYTEDNPVSVPELPSVAPALGFGTDIPPELAVSLDGTSMGANGDLYVDELPLAVRSFGISQSEHGIPAYYLTPDVSMDDEPVFVFEYVDEHGLGKWARFVEEELYEGMSEYALYYALKDESPLSNQEIDYLMDNHEWLFSVAESQGWVY